jgi:hypothetical protein
MTRQQRALARAREEAAANEAKRPYVSAPPEFKVGNEVRVKLPESRRSSVDDATGQPRTYPQVGGSLGYSGRR